MKIIYLIPVLLLTLFMVYGMANSSVNPDKDFDKVPDLVDKCPGTPPMRKPDADSKYAALYSAEELSTAPRSVAVDTEGCVLDSDVDGVADYLDYCPDNSPEELAAGVHKNGCPLQSDGDGTPDYRDKCPATPRGIKTDHHGCHVNKHA